MDLIRKISDGFTLIEILIAVVILSIGLLGMAGIQIKGLRGTTSSNQRSQAALLANDIAERIHVNTNGIGSSDASINTQYANVDTGQITCGQNVPAFCSATPATTDANGNLVPSNVTPCSASAMATFDIYDFACGLQDNAGVKNLLPGGSATITCNAASCPPGSQLTIQVNWTEVKPDSGDSLNQKVTMVVIP